MPSLAARSRIPVRVNDSVVPAAASRQAVNTADDIATLLSAMSISKPTIVKPTSASPSTSHASRSKLHITTAISATKDCPPLRQHRQRSLANIAPSANSASVLDRIAERRQRVIANLAPGPKRSTPSVRVTPTSTFKSSSTSSRVPSSTTTTAAPVSIAQPSSTSSAAAIPVAVPVAAPVAAPVALPVADDVAAVPAPVNPAIVPTPRQYVWLTVQMPENYRQNTPGKRGHIERIVEISDRVWDSDSLIPSAFTSRKPRARVPGRFKPATIPLTRTPVPHHLSSVFLPHTVSQLPSHFAQVYLPPRLRSDNIRGTSDYCPARPHFPMPRGAYGYGILYKGRTCSCCEVDGDIPLRVFNIPPNQWATTPAESGVDLNPPRRVRNKKVRFAEDLLHVFPGSRDPEASFVYKGTSKDTTTRAQDFPEGFPLYKDHGRGR
ncbi:hypothetical protein IMSHALPRED_007429 [Imshaugia aleurites]|uniref:Uncharacterized protein n=1 Tax=Imshaugia aleurites TaxID=172621 RepID=A0A8H3FNG9_9LECA|nr:hypothetical protein IMSHALPRED_007429 [Imshaugia aleurites]